MSSRAPTIADADDFAPIEDVAVQPETVDLAEIDLDFAGEERRHTDAASVRAAGGVVVAASGAPDLARVDLFRGVAGADLALFAAQTAIIEAAPGSVLQPSGIHSDRIFFVVEGELRLYADLKEKRPRGIVDAGQSIGLSWALDRKRTEVIIVVTEAARVLELRLAQLEEFARRSHPFSCNLNALYAAYLRGDNCLNTGARTLAALHHSRGFTDELTQLHSEHWLTTMLPRLLQRSRFDSAPLTVAMLAVDKLDAINHDYGTIAGEQILSAVGELMLDVARTTDLLVCDENRRFLAVLPNTAVEGARIFCQRMRRLLHSLRVGAPEDQPLPALTLSCAVVAVEGGVSESELMARLNALVQRSIESGGDVLSE